MHRVIPILIKVWAGPEKHDLRYIKKSLRSLLVSQLPAHARIILVDDCSTNPRLQPFLQWCIRQDQRFELWQNPYRMGPNQGQEYNFPLMVTRYPDSKYYGNCDDDIIYHPGWLQRLVKIAEESQAEGLNGIFTAMNTPFREHYDQKNFETSEVLLKERQAAFNWLIPANIYHRVGPFLDTGVAFDTDYTNRLIALNIPVICLKPSWIQNIGYKGAYQSSDALKSHDFVGTRDIYLYTRDKMYNIHRGLSFALEKIEKHAPFLKQMRNKLKGKASKKRPHGLLYTTKNVPAHNQSPIGNPPKYPEKVS